MERGHAKEKDSENCTVMPWTLYEPVEYELHRQEWSNIWWKLPDADNLVMMVMWEKQLAGRLLLLCQIFSAQNTWIFSVSKLKITKKLLAIQEKKMGKSFTSPIYDKVRIKPMNGMYKELWSESDRGHYQLTWSAVRFAKD